MQRKRIKNISNVTNNHYETLHEAMSDFLKFKTAQGMSELTIRAYNNTFERFMRQSGNLVQIDILKKSY
ncbi:MAG TPA: hypothetical protein VIO64_15565 [Pseudobacteroides sp.]|uniref:hypothetical protein n=1 Tax=Pseudobacteroides sp. TaxID=1968840 RepID=UPI002F94E7CC